MFGNIETGRNIERTCTGNNLLDKTVFIVRLMKAERHMGVLDINHTEAFFHITNTDTFQYGSHRTLHIKATSI